MGGCVLCVCVCVCVCVRGPMDRKQSEGKIMSGKEGKKWGNQDEIKYKNLSKYASGVPGTAEELRMMNLPSGKIAWKRRS